MKYHFSEALSSILSLCMPTSGTVAVLAIGADGNHLKIWEPSDFENPSVFRKDSMCLFDGFSVKDQIKTILAGNSKADDDILTPGMAILNQVALQDSKSLTHFESKVLSLASQLAAAEDFFIIPDLSDFEQEEKGIEIYDNILERSICRSTPTLCFLSQKDMLEKVDFPQVIICDLEGIVFEGNAKFATLIL